MMEIKRWIQKLTGQTPGRRFPVKKAGAILAVIAVLALALSLPAHAGIIPTTSIVKVEKDVSVTVETYNFPANLDFVVRIGPFGTLGVGGTVVETFNSGAGGTFQRTISIPAVYAGSAKLAIRFDSTVGGYYAYDWFVNNTSALTATPTTVSGTPAATATPAATTISYAGIPTTSISSVVTDTSVTIQTHNFPAHQTFTVRMGPFGTLAIGGEVVGTTDSGTGGSFSVTYNIPAGLKGSARIAIRMDSPAGYYAYDWFQNTTASATATYGTGGPYTTPVSPIPGYTGYPLISIASVSPDSSVTISGTNFPPHQTFNVRMAAFGGLGVGGVIVDTIDSGDGGTYTGTFTIPDSLKGSARIAIRFDGSQYGYYSYDWFVNTP